MKKTAILLIINLLITAGLIAQVQEDLTKIIEKMAAELESKHSGLTKVKVAILQFRTQDNKLTKFNDFMQNELYKAYKNSERFEIIDQNAINDLIQSYGWTNDKARNFKYNNDFGKYIFQELGFIANSMIFGKITDNDQTITISVNLIPNGINKNIYTVETLKSSPFTDNLLGKPTKEHDKQPNVVYVEKEVIIEKPVIVEKVVEKEVIVEKVVEKEVIVEKPVASAKPAAVYKAGIGDYNFEIISAQFTGNKITIAMQVINEVSEGYIYAIDSRIIDLDGNEYTSGYSNNNLRDRKLMQGTPLKGIINFESSGVAKVFEIETLEINVYKSFGLEKHGTIRFNNIPIDR